MEDKLGIKMNVFRDGDLKGMGVFGKELTELEGDYLQDRVMECSERFKGFVRDRRPGIADETMQGQTFESRNARELNLIDGVFSDLAFLVSRVAG